MHRVTLLPSVTPIVDPAREARNQQRIATVLRESRPISDRRGAQPVRRYLTARGLGDVLRDPCVGLFSHPGLVYWDALQQRGTFPAMITPIQSASGELVAIHATYLRSDGGAKAAVTSPKKILYLVRPGATKGAAIRLLPPLHRNLGVAEGVENALSLGLLHSVPTWAAICADNLGRIELPKRLAKIFIAVDRDANGKGEEGARVLGAQLLTRNPRPAIFLVRPAAGLHDLNDELRAFGSTI